MPEEREAEHRRERLVEEPQHDVRETAASVGLRDPGTRVAEAGDRAIEVEHRRLRQGAVRRVRGQDGIDVARDDATRGLGEHPLGLAELEVQDALRISRPRARPAPPRRGRRRAHGAR